MILDQRHLSGAWKPSTPAEVVDAWRAIADYGFNPTAPGLLWTPRELTETSEKVAARVDDNRWLADCPACRSGVVCWPEHDRACCFGCFRVYGVEFPPRETREKAEAVLLERPVDARHWRPGSETVDDLRRENQAHADEVAEYARLRGVPGAPETLAALHEQASAS